MHTAHPVVSPRHRFKCGARKCALHLRNAASEQVLQHAPHATREAWLQRIIVQLETAAPSAQAVVALPAPAAPAVNFALEQLKALK